MANPEQVGAAELRAARRESRWVYGAVGLFSLAVNALMLTGPLYMLNVYDRVLGSQSVATLVGLTVLVAFLLGMMGLLDMVRGRVMSRVAGRFHGRLGRRVFEASVRGNGLAATHTQAASALRDLDSVQRLIGSPALMALFDMPFAPLFFFGIFLFHPWLGYLGLAGAGVLVVLAIANQVTARRSLEKMNSESARSEALGGQIRQEAELVQTLGMRGAAFDRWQDARGQALVSSLAATDTTGAFSSWIKAFRLFLQSAMLGLGAYLVLQNTMTPGAMIAGSILLGRALAPIEMVVNQSALFQRAHEGWKDLSVLLGHIRPIPPRTVLPRPAARLLVDQLTIVIPGETAATLRMLTFNVEPGQAVGVIGMSGAGKSTLAKALTGLWKPAAGQIRLDGAALDQFDPDTLGTYIGYLPQRVGLFDGTIRENIARLSKTPDDAAVVEAARNAAAHDMILKLPEGYDTRVTALGGRLSGGQLQRIGLARALYGDPVMLVLDEPNSNLDNDGSEALNEAIRKFKAQGKAVLIMAHRPMAIKECEMLLVLEAGTRRAFGPRDEVLKTMVKNSAEIQTGGTGGVS